MAHIKLKRAHPTIDMTPMVDVAFLLVTFFILVTKFVAKEAVPVDTPSSVNDMTIENKNLMTITVSDDGRVFFDMVGKFDRDTLISRIDRNFKLSLTDDEKNNFALMSSFGVPINGLKDVLDMSANDRDEYKWPGIPVDSTNNELDDWIMYARNTNPGARVAIKGDRESDYKAMQRVIQILTTDPVHVLRFELITTLEQKPGDAAAADATQGAPLTTKPQ